MHITLNTYFTLTDRVINIFILINLLILLCIFRNDHPKIEICFIKNYDATIKFDVSNIFANVH